MRVVVDTGPLVALVDRHEKHHAWACAQFASVRPPLLTCEAVIAEATYLLRSAGVDATAVLDLLERGAVRVSFDLATEVASVATLMRRYSPRMDLADACLVRMTEQARNVRVLTLDGDFLFYRRNGRQTIAVTMPKR